jgi:ankyrin repeat protein
MDIFAALSKKDPTKLSELLAGGANPNQTNPDGLTALHFAATDSSIECLELLLKQVRSLNEYQCNQLKV